MEIKLPKNLTKWQKELINDVGTGFREQDRDLLIIAPRQSFKSSTVALIQIIGSLTYKGDGVYIAPTLQQSRSQMADIASLLAGSNLITQINYQTLELTFKNGSRIYFRSGQQKDSLRGLTAENFLILDEVAFISEDFIYTALPLRRVKKALTIFISTPLTTEGFFWRKYNDPNTRVYDWSKYINLIYSEDDLKRLKEQYSPFRYTTEILGQFAPSGQGLLFTNLNNCIGEASNKDNVVIGIDCSSALDGDFTAVTVINDSFEIVDIYFDNQKTPSERLMWLSNIINSYESVKRVVIENNNMGGTIIDFLKKRVKFPITSWTTTNKSKNEIITTLQLALENKEITLINNPELIKELQCFQATIKGNTVTYAGKNAKDDLVMSTAIAYYSLKKSFGTYSLA